MDLKVLYEDNHLIAVYKPAGVLVQSDKTGDSTLMDEVKYYLKQRYHKTGQVFLGLIHRLDRPAQGIILFAKTSKGASRLSEQFREHKVEKIYHALVVGKPPKSKEGLVHFLEKDGNKNRTTVHGLPTTGASRAELSYEVIKTNGKFSLLKIILGTGRSHQIRAQLAYIGCPIVGDVKYGAPASPRTSAGSQTHHVLELAATELSFTTAIGDEEKHISVEVPAEWVKLAS